MAINEGKLNELLGKMVTELGAALVGASVILGDQLGYTRNLPLAAPSRQRSWPSAPARRNAMCANGWRDRQHPGTSTMTRPPGHFNCRRNRQWSSPRPIVR